MKETGPMNWEIRPILTQSCTTPEILEIKKRMIRNCKADIKVNTPVKHKKKKYENDIFNGTFPPILCQSY